MGKNTPKNHPLVMQPIVTGDCSVTMYNPVLGETYHSREGALLEARSLYIDGSQFNQALCPQSSNVNVLAVLDVGLGLGYNALSTIAAWLEHPAPRAMHLVSLEKDFTTVKQLFSGQAPWQEKWPQLWLDVVGLVKNQDSAVWQGVVAHPKSGSMLEWTIYLADFRECMLPDVAQYSYVWQDPFSPTTNPDLWNSRWFRKVAAVCLPGARLMSYSVAGSVRRSLSEAGWAWEKIPTPTCKREWLRATLTAT